MNLTWHIIKKDLCRFRLPISVWALAGTIVLVLNLRHVWTEAYGGSVGQMIATFSAVAFFLLGIALLGWFVQEDNVASPGAFWQSRPISGGQLLAAKASTAFVLLVFIPMLASDACAQGHLVSMQTWGAFGRHLFVLTALTVYGMAMAAATRENGAFVLGCVAAISVFSVNVPIDMLLNHGPIGPAARFASVAVIGAGGLAGILNQYLRRKTMLTFAVLGATIMIAVLVWELWPRSDPNSIRPAPALPSEQLVRSEGSPKYAAVRADLLGILENDQKYRLQMDALSKTYSFSSPEMIELSKKMREVDSINLAKVKAILEKYGWLGQQDIGSKANLALFLVIQHADPLTQREYLPIMREAVKTGRANGSSLALLEDRVAIGEGRPQIYGSQLYQEGDGPLIVQAMEDPDHVDERRASIGLPPMAEYVKHWNLTWDLAAYKKQLPDLLAQLSRQHA